MYKKTTLKNGLNVVTSNMPHMESIAIGLWIGVGARYEDKVRSGLSHLMEHMVFKGTTKRTANMLKESIEGVGGSFNGFTSEEVTCYLVKLPARYMELGMDILSDMVQSPALDPGDLEREKMVICEEIKMYMDQPGQHVFDVLAHAMWPAHALGRPILGYMDTVTNFTRGDLFDFKKDYYQPANISIVIAGKLDRHKGISFAKNTFSTPSARKRFCFPAVREKHKKSRLEMFNKKTKQTHVAFGFHSLYRDHKLRYALGLLNVILGGNMSSRLFDSLRERQGLCYDVSSSVKKYKETGAFIIHAGVDNHKLLNATKEIVKEVRDIKKNRVKQDELKRAKEYSRGQFLLALEDTGSRMLWLGDRITQEGEAPPVKKIFKNIERVTAEDVRRVANIVFRKQNMSVATVGPVNKERKKKIERALDL